MNKYIDKNYAFRIVLETIALSEEKQNEIKEKFNHAAVQELVPIIYAHWILEREPNGNPYCYHCSHCDNDFHNIRNKCANKYCPDCGAIMDEEIEDYSFRDTCPLFY